MQRASVAGIVRRRHDDDRHRAAGEAAAQGLEHPEAVEPRHVHVEQQDRGPEALGLVERLDAVGRLGHLEALRP